MTQKLDLVFFDTFASNEQLDATAKHSINEQLEAAWPLKMKLKKLEILVAVDTAFSDDLLAVLTLGTISNDYAPRVNEATDFNDFVQGAIVNNQSGFMLTPDNVLHYCFPVTPDADSAALWTIHTDIFCDMMRNSFNLTLDFFTADGGNTTAGSLGFALIMGVDIL